MEHAISDVDQLMGKVIVGCFPVFGNSLRPYLFYFQTRILSHAKQEIPTCWFGFHNGSR